MATRIKVMKLLQEMRGFAEISNRRPQSRSPGLYMLQMRSQVLRATLSKRRQTISIEMQNRPDIPDPVKIRHVTGSPHPVHIQAAQ